MLSLLPYTEVNSNSYYHMFNVPLEIGVHYVFIFANPYIYSYESNYWNQENFLIRLPICSQYPPEDPVIINEENDEEYKGYYYEATIGIDNLKHLREILSKHSVGNSIEITVYPENDGRKRALFGNHL